MHGPPRKRRLQPMIRRRTSAADMRITTEIGCRTFPATADYSLSQERSKLEIVQRIANHKSSRTIRFTIRRNHNPNLDEVESMEFDAAGFSEPIQTPYRILEIVRAEQGLCL
jgi:hypothetical protein